jgi:hypothetical protein
MRKIISVVEKNAISVEIAIRDNKIVGIKRHSPNSPASDKIIAISRIRIPTEQDFVKIEKDFPGATCYCHEMTQNFPTFGGAICSI